MKNYHHELLERLIDDARIEDLDGLSDEAKQHLTELKEARAAIKTKPRSAMSTKEKAEFIRSYGAQAYESLPMK